MVEERAVIEGDHRCFSLDGVTPSTAGAEVPGTLVEWLDVDEYDVDKLLIVKTGSQLGPFAVTLRTLAAAPLEDAEWEDVTEISVIASPDIALSELVGGPKEWIPITPGPHRVRVSARGRSESDERERTFPDDDIDLDDEVPLEHYLVEMWPAPPAPPIVVRETSRYARDETDPPPPNWPKEREPGLVAARAVTADLRRSPGCRALSGRTCDVRVSVEAPLTQRQAFNRAKLANGWPPSRGGGLSENTAVGDLAYHHGDAPESDGPLLGMIETEVVEVDAPKRFVISWNWRQAGPDGQILHTSPELLPNGSRVAITCVAIDGAGQDARTLVALLHSGVPEEWDHDLARLWEWDLAQRLRA